MDFWNGRAVTSEAHHCRDDQIKEMDILPIELRRLRNYGYKLSRVTAYIMVHSSG